MLATASHAGKEWRPSCTLGRAIPQMYQSLHKRGINKVQVLSLKRTVRELMTHIPKLEKINLSGCYNFSDQVIDSGFWKRDYANLKVLNLSLCKEIRDGAMLLLGKRCPNLEELDLAGCTGITNLGIRALAVSFKNLTKLNLRSCRQVTDNGIGHLARLESRLEELSLQDCQKLTDESLNLLARDCQCLSKLNLSFCVSITDTGLKSLGKLKTLRSLNLRSCDNVSDIGIAFLAELTSSLQDVDVSFCANVTNSSLLHIASGFPELKSLSMTTCSINDEGLKQMAKRLTKLESLNIGQCISVSDDGLKFLSENLKNLRFLDAYGCPKISSECVDDILDRNPTLERVNRQLWLFIPPSVYFSFFKLSNLWSQTVICQRKYT